MPGAFKLDHLHPVEQILFPNISNLLAFILGGPIFYYPRVEEAEYEKRELSKMDVTQLFLYLGYSKWTICSHLLISDFQNLMKSEVRLG